MNNKRFKTTAWGVDEPGQNFKQFEISIFNGEYPTSISSDYLEDLELSRRDDQKVAREKSN